MKENIKVTITENRTELPELATFIMCLLTATNYKETVTWCDALLAVALESPVTITRRGDRIRVLINTPNRKTLASGIVDAIRHYFGDPRNIPANTADPAIIIDRATAWAQAQPDADMFNPQEYAAIVADEVNKFLQKKNFDEAERNAIVGKVQEWYNKKMEQPEPLNDEQPANPVPVSQDAQRATPTTIDESIYNILLELYDLLVKETVIAEKLTKGDFVDYMEKGEVPSMSKDSPKSWVLVKYKFKHTIKKIRPFFDANWYDAVCKSANLSPLQMGKYNTQELEEFDRKLQKIGLK